MPGMSSNVQDGNPVVISSFYNSLFHQALVIGLILVALWIGWNVLRAQRYRRAAAVGAGPGRPAVSVTAESAPRRFLRIGFGLIWVLDGLLQLQSGMVLGFPSNVLQPAASASPGWVQHLVNVGVTIWNNHPVEAAVSAVWIQLGIGVLLLTAPRGRWQQLAGIVSVGWGLVVWSFGEAFGGIFGSGASWLFGAPGAVVFYCVAGVLVALPERVWSSPAIGRVILRVMGAFFVGMAILQAWPGRGSWQGSAGHSSLGATASMVEQMSQTGQPGFLAATLRAFERFDAAHGWGVNLVVVLLLAAIGLAFCTARVRVVRLAAYAALALCVADWVLVQDLGFLGGTGTDPNSMLPMALVFVSGYLAITRVRTPMQEEAAPAGAEVAEAVPPDRRPWWEKVPLGDLARVATSLAALFVIGLGAVPMAAAATNPNADPILAVAADGTPVTVDTPAPDFHLVDQNGAPVSLSDLRGRTLALTFLDPVCTSDCPVIAQEFREANAILGSDSSRVDFVAVVANPIYRATSFTRAFDQQEGLEHMRNWFYLTGSAAALKHVWDSYGTTVSVAPAGSMVVHSELAFVIDGAGRTREVIDADPGNLPSSHSSFSVYLANSIEHVLHE